MNLDSDNPNDAWLSFAKMTAKSLVKLENKGPSEASVMFLTALEDLLDGLHSCPPGMVSACLHVANPKEHCPQGIGAKIAGLEPQFSIDDSSLFMGTPEDVREATLATINEAWEYMARSIDIWHDMLSEIEDETEKRRSRHS